MLQSFREVWAQLIQSTKFMTALAGILGMVLAKVGFNAEPEVINGIIGIVSLLILSQGMKDLGAKKASIETDPKLKILDQILGEIKKQDTTKQEEIKP